MPSRGIILIFCPGSEEKGPLTLARGHGGSRGRPSSPSAEHRNTARWCTDIPKNRRRRQRFRRRTEFKPSVVSFCRAHFPRTYLLENFTTTPAILSITLVTAPTSLLDSRIPNPMEANQPGTPRRVIDSPRSVYVDAMHQSCATNVASSVMDPFTAALAEGAPSQQLALRRRNRLGLSFL